MTPRPFDLELQMDRHGAALRQLAGALVRDSNGADDAVQETWVRAVQRPPRHEDAVGGWLATILHNVARKLRRSERRRLRREAMAAQLRANEVEDHSTALAREELVHRLVAAVTSLDAPFREAIWQRYFEGLAPREIATARGVPLATVKSRLQRGLGLLREKLGEREGTDWRAGLLVAFGWQEGVVGSGTAAATMWPGVLLMTAWMKSAAAVLVVLGAGFLWWSLREQAVPVPVVVVDVGKEAGAVSASVGAKDQDDTVGVVPPVVERTAVEPAVAANPRNATVRGRCVDEHGVPLAGCRLSVGGIIANEKRMEAWRRDHDEPEWRGDPSYITGADGTFSMVFWPPPPFGFWVSARMAGCVTMRGYWEAIAEGAVVDLGDVPILPGVQVRGNVAMASGRPALGATIHLSRVLRADEVAFAAARMQPDDACSGVSASDGSITMSPSVREGIYTARLLTDGVLVAPTSITLVASRPVESAAFVLADPPDVPTIEGRVIDDAGQPVGNARVASLTSEGRARVGAVSAPDGSFVIRAKAGTSSLPGRVLVVMERYEQMTTKEPIPWNTRGLELRLERGHPMSVQVKNPSGMPLTDYSIRVVPSETIQLNGEPRSAKGPFEGGLASLPGVIRGSYHAILDFKRDSGYANMVVPFEMSGAPLLLNVQAGVQPTRTLRVVDAEGAPVAGTRAELCELFGHPFRPSTLVVGPGTWPSGGGFQRALILEHGSTGVDGRLLLHGPAGRALGLRVLGPGHVPTELSDVRMDQSEELVVVVRKGARLRGRVSPPEVLRELRRLGAVADGDSFAADRQPYLQLGREGGLIVPARRGAEAEPFAIAEDGTFDVAGVPAGTWHVGVAYWFVQEFVSQTKHIAAGDLVLVDGETRELELDLRHLLPGTLEALVTTNGVPLAKRRVWLESPIGMLPDGRLHMESIGCETDDQGRFVFLGRPATYELKVPSPRERGSQIVLRAPGKAMVLRGDVTRHTFALHVGTLKVRLLDRHGQPVTGASLRLGATDNTLPLTVEDGSTSAEVAAGTFTLRILPKGLQSEAAQAKVVMEARAAGRSDPFAELWMAVCTATITAGETTSLELRLPPEWEK
jgi:RNA polymerase sigma factor (sigma-70 family)